MFDPIKASKNIKDEYVSYISSSFQFADPNLKKRFREELDKMVSQGPYLEINDVFKNGKSIKGLVEEKVLSPLFIKLEEGKRLRNEPEVLPLERPLYLHQEKAIRALAKGKNAVISTGTGSGKTNCFLIPVLNDLLKEKEAGTLKPGIRALFIYPMNALANDQIKNIRRLLMDYPDITFVVYNGATEYKESDAEGVYRAMFSSESIERLRTPLPNEFLSRDKMKETPPHILFTNYAMLEHLLFRPGDDVLFSSSDFRFVVLDEAHVYSGATGIETSILLRRLRARICSTRGTQFILTSATLGTKADSSEDIIRFAENLCGVDFRPENIIRGERQKYIPRENGVRKFDYQVIRELANEQNKVAEVLDKHGIAHGEGKEEELLYEFIESSWQYQVFRSGAERVNELDGIASLLGTTMDNCVAFVSICSRARKNGKALIDARYHFFIRSLEGCFVSLAPGEQRRLSLVRKTQEDDYGVFEIALCNDCGKFALVGKIEGNHLRQVSKIGEQADYFYFCDEEKADIEEDDELEGDPVPASTYFLCPHCGAIVETNRVNNKPCDHDPGEYIKIAKAKRPNGDKSENPPRCAYCKTGEYKRVYLGNDAATSVLATSLYEELPELAYKEIPSVNKGTNNIFLNALRQSGKREERKMRQFLVFSDSRQEAAKFACYLEKNYQEFLRRRGVCHVIEKYRDQMIENPWTIADFANELTRYFSNHRSFSPEKDHQGNLDPISRENAYVALLNELARADSPTSLTSLGFLQFEYLGNEALAEMVAKKYPVDPRDAKDLLEILVYEMVKMGAVSSSFDLGDSNREYIFYTPMQQFVAKNISKPGVKRWLPRNKPGKNDCYYRSNRLDYVMRFLGITEKEAHAFLEDYFEALKYHMKSPNVDETYVMPEDCFAIRVQGDPSIKWYRCKKCGKVSTHQMRMHCISPCCDGEVEEVADPRKLSEGNHYAELYQSDLMDPLYIKEHTAQLSKKESTDYQQQFVLKKLNALSCSTTFEMGVDVGDLETVFLRDVPPLPSNYAQRAGRAGRSLEAAAYCLTFAKLSSHDLSFFKDPKRMISGAIVPPIFKVDNEKIVRRHVYSVALSMFFKDNPEMYNANNANKFINEKGYLKFYKWLDSKPERLKDMLKRSIPDIDGLYQRIGIDDFRWIDGFKGGNGVFSSLVNNYEATIKEFEKRIDENRASNIDRAGGFQRKLERFKENQLIDFLARGNILPKYGFPVDTVELEQTVSADNVKKLRLSRDLSIAIAEYAPSSEVIADGKMYTSRYIKKTNEEPEKGWRTAYIGVCPNSHCQATNYSVAPIGSDGVKCIGCGNTLHDYDFEESIEPVSGFATEDKDKAVPLSKQTKNFRSEDVYIGNIDSKTIDKRIYLFNNTRVEVESTTNDSLMVKSTNAFYVCPTCGYAIAEDETIKDDSEANKLIAARANEIETKKPHKSLFIDSNCRNKKLRRYSLHHVFNTDVAKLNFSCDTSDRKTMLSVMYAILYAICECLNIERKDLKACLSWKVEDLNIKYSIIIYDAVPGGAGHSRRLVTEDGRLLQEVLGRAYSNMISCHCDPSCYNCLRSYENQRIHDELDRNLAAAFFGKLLGDVIVIDEK